MNESTHQTPFFLLMGYNPRANWIDKPSRIPQVVLRIDQFKQARKAAQEALTRVQQLWIKHCDMPRYKEGDQVWLDGKNLQMQYPTRKFGARRYGPLQVKQVMSPVNYCLELPTQWSIHDVFHTDLLTPYTKTKMHGPNYTRPVPDLIDGQEEYEIEKVINSRYYGRRRKLQFLVRWNGSPDSDNEWFAKENVS